VVLSSIATLAIFIPGCTTWPAGDSGASFRPLEPSIAADLAPFGAPRQLELEWVERSARWHRYRLGFSLFSAAAGDWIRVTGDYYEARGVRGRRPIVAISPILAGPIDDYLSARYIATSAARRGISSFFLNQDTLIFDPRRDTIEIEEWARENVRAYRAGLDLLARLDWVDVERSASFGVSLGGIKNVLLAAAEPRLAAHAIALAGGGMASLVTRSDEPLVGRFLEGRRRLDGLEPDEVGAEIARWLILEPTRVAPSVARGSTVLFLARFDQVIPFASAMALHDRLGAPAATSFVAGHYSTIALAPWIAGRAFDAFESRWRANSSLTSRESAATRRDPAVARGGNRFARGGE
jgi:hypothetical protein